MSFLFPGFLYAFFLLSIPIIIHLFNFRRFRTVYFTNVRFLRNIQEETATRNRLKHLLVLIARLFALAFLILAFAQPYKKADGDTRPDVSRSASIYIDNSFSMESMQNNTQLLDAAKQKAEEIVAAYGVDDKFQLLTNDFEARQQHMVNKEEVLEMIRNVQISPAVRDLKDVTSRQKDILSRAEENEKDIYVLSDFQKSSTDLQNDTAYTFSLIPLTGSEERNLSIDSVWFTTPVQIPGQQSQLCFKIFNYGNEDVEHVSISLKINDQVKGIAEVSLTAKSNITDTLRFTVSETGLQNCALSLTDYPITFDDIFYFSYEPVQKIPVVCINGKGTNNFITTAYNNPLFSLQQYDAAQIDFNDLDRYAIVILNELRDISSGLATALTKKLDQGATILFIPSFDQDNNSVNSFLASNTSGVYNGVSMQKRNTASVNMRAAVFSGVFEKFPANISLPYADKSFFISSGSRNIEEVILQTTDGSPLLARYGAGNGNIYLSAVPFDKTATDLPVQGGLFVPFMYRIALMSMQQQALYVLIGREQWVRIRSDGLEADETVTLKGPDEEFIPAIRRNASGAEMDVSNYAQQAGIYSVSGKNIKQSLAMNYDRRESDLSFYSAADLKEKYPAENIRVLDDPHQKLSTVIAQMQQGRPLWKFCIIFTLLFLAIEIVLIRFML